jgi:hypothetical protein
MCIAPEQLLNIDIILAPIASPLLLLPHLHEYPAKQVIDIAWILEKHLKYVIWVEVIAIKRLVLEFLPILLLWAKPVIVGTTWLITEASVGLP